MAFNTSFVSFDRCLSLLHETGYTGHLSIECEGQGGPLLTQSLQWLRQALAGLGIPEEKA
jgi:sugar phosphate isomerase/epimerase